MPKNEKLFYIVFPIDLIDLLHDLGGQVCKILPQLVEPGYATGNNYMRAGIPIILMPDEDYRSKYPESNTNYFVHHMYVAYAYLLKKWYGQ